MDRTSAWPYHQRAACRWHQKDYSGALSDWQEAISLKNDKALFHAQAARACQKLQRGPEAIEYITKAVDLEPDNNRYKDLKKVLTDQK